jgi:hypothetical protein
MMTSLREYHYPIFMRSFTMLLGVSLALATTGLVAREAGHLAARPDSGRLGTVHFETSCSTAAQPQFDRAMALLHSFEFGQAISAFSATINTDPRCGMAYWGIALCRWGNPFAPGQVPAGQLRAGADAVARARSAGLKSEREKAYVAAVGELFAGFESKSQGERLAAYEQAMARLTAKYPTDREASIFYALALAASAPPGDKTYAKQLQAGAILERLFAEQPNHPGLAHYIIHAYDVPPLAPKALGAARRYARIAPDAPHALHMPSHTFTRLGLWQESIDTNKASAAAARRQRETGEELHAMDYEVYAYLQTGQDRAAKDVLDDLANVAARLGQGAVESAAPARAAVFAVAAIPARWALERRQWGEAAALVPQPGDYPFTEALTHFARALGAAHTGDLAKARDSIGALQALQTAVAQAKEPYWAEQIDIERRGAQAWLALAEGRSSEAVTMMQEAATMEDATEKSAITPGPLVPARELLGEMLLQMNRPSEAERAFLVTLEREPHRFRAEYGVARAARLAGDLAVARKYYDALLKICERADAPGRPELVEAREFVASAR